MARIHEQNWAQSEVIRSPQSGESPGTAPSRLEKDESSTVRLADSARGDEAAGGLLDGDDDLIPSNANSPQALGSRHHLGKSRSGKQGKALIAHRGLDRFGGLVPLGRSRGDIWREREDE